MHNYSYNYCNYSRVRRWCVNGIQLKCTKYIKTITYDPRCENNRYYYRKNIIIYNITIVHRKLWFDNTSSNYKFFNNNNDNNSNGGFFIQLSNELLEKWPIYYFICVLSILSEGNTNGFSKTLLEVNIVKKIAFRKICSTSEKKTIIGIEFSQ